MVVYFQMRMRLSHPPVTNRFSTFICDAAAALASSAPVCRQRDGREMTVR